MKTAADTIRAVSLYCGAGGESLGVDEAFRRAGVDPARVQRHAVNHWDLAVYAHALNMPNVALRQEDLSEVSAWDFGLGGERIKILWGSPPCTHHSRARGGKPSENQQRSHAWAIIENWLDCARVDALFIENVIEWMEWGPVHEDHSNGCNGHHRIKRRERIIPGKRKAKEVPKYGCLPGCHHGHPIKELRGFDFVSFVLALQDRGYQVEYRILNAADYGAATSRRRLFLIATRDGKPPAWPRPTHRNSKAKAGKYDPALPTWRPAKDCIDWSDLGTSIFERDRELAEATKKRIAAGLVRYVIEAKQPFIVNLSHGVSHGYGLQDFSEALRTQTGRQDKALVAPVLTYLRGTGADQFPNTSAGPDDPVRTISAGGNHAALIAPLLTTYHGPKKDGEARAAALDMPIPTLDTSNRFGLVAPILTSIDHQSTGESAVRSPGDPLSTMTTKARHAVVAATLMANNTNNAPHHPEEPLGAVTTGDRHYVVASFLERNFGGGATGTAAPAVSLDSPMPTVTAHDHSSLVAAFLLHYYSSGGQAQSPDDPLHTVTTLARHGLVTVTIDGETYIITDIRMRMLRPDELALAMGFPRWYRWEKPSGKPLSDRDKVKMIGNAVEVHQAEAILHAHIESRPEDFLLYRPPAPSSDDGFALIQEVA